jgi:type II secretory pathway pseudopilin PulG
LTSPRLAEDVVIMFNERTRMTGETTAGCWQRRRRCAAFTLVELLVTIGLLVIVFALAASLARKVKSEASHAFTTDLLVGLDSLMSQYQQRYGRLPELDSVLPAGALTDEANLERNAEKNNQQFLRALQGGPPWDHFCAGLPAYVYDPSRPSLRDSWGMPIVFMPKGHSPLGSAPLNKKFFFLSAGPDQHYLTIIDNLYSYEHYYQADLPQSSRSTMQR